MIECKNCGYVNLGDSLYCEECGEKLEKESSCPSCGATIKARRKFCSKCGSRLDNLGMTIGDRNVIGGDVVSKKEETRIAGNATIIKNEDQTKRVEKCHVCGRMITLIQGFECPDCGGFTCKSCLDEKEGVCRSCANERKENREKRYKKAYLKASEDGVIDLAEEKELKNLQRELGLSDEDVRRIEGDRKGYQNGIATLTTYEKITLRKSEETAFDDGKYVEAKEKLEPIFLRHQNNEEVLRVYLPCLVMADSNEAKKVIRGINADVLIAKVSDAYMKIREKEYAEAEMVLKQAERIWPGNVLVDCTRIMYLCALSKTFSDKSFYEQAEEIAGELGECNDKLERSCKERAKASFREDSSVYRYDEKHCADNDIYRSFMNNIAFVNSEATVGIGRDYDFSSLKDAIDYIRSGGTIHIAPGVYREECLILSKRVVIKGCEDDIKKKHPSEIPIVVIGNNGSIIDGDVKIEGVLFTRNENLEFETLDKLYAQNPSGNDVASDEGGCFIKISSDAVMTNCALIGNGTESIEFTEGRAILEDSIVSMCRHVKCSGNSQPAIKECLISENSGDGVIVCDNSSPSLESCEIYNNRNGAGLFLYGKSAGTYKDCIIHDNKTEGKNYVGIGISGESNPTLENCEIFNHIGSGIFILGTAKGRINGCKVHDNGSNGIRVQDYADPSVESCEIYSNRNGAGLYLHGKSTGTYKDCIIHDNKTEGENYVGIAIFEESNPTLENCEIFNHIRVGIYIKGTAKGRINGCKVHDNGSNGIRVQDYASPLVTGCDIYDNNMSGIKLSKRTGGTCHSCKIFRNKGKGIEIEKGTTKFVTNNTIKDNEQDGLFDPIFSS